MTKATGKGRGGARRNAGRRRPGGIPWKAVREHAESGSPRVEIMEALGIPHHVLENPKVLARLDREIEVGHARYKIHLRLAIKERSDRTVRTSGSVSALALQARNVLDWDKQMPAQVEAPDLAGARQQLRDTFAKICARRSEELGRTVTPEELVRMEAADGEGAA